MELDPRAIVALVTEEMHANYQGENIARACLYWAECTRQRLAAIGHTVCLQAGSLHWRFAPDEAVGPDDPTAFSYEFHLDEAVPRICAGLLPEMHVWVGDVERQEIIDLTTRFLPANALEHGFRWIAKRPPPYVWHTADVLYSTYECQYEPDRDATLLAYALLKASPWRADEKGDLGCALKNLLAFGQIQPTA